MPLFHLLKYRSFLPAAVCCIGTAGMEFTSRRWIVGTWHVTFQNDTLTFLLHIRKRDCGKKSFCIGVHRIGIKLGFFCNLNHTSKIHNCDSVTDMADYAQVMGDKQVGQIFFCCIFLIRFSTCARTDTSVRKPPRHRQQIPDSGSVPLQFRFAASDRLKTREGKRFNTVYPVQPPEGSLPPFPCVLP